MVASPLCQYLIVQLVVMYGYVLGSDKTCQSFEFYSTPAGKYCPGDGALLQSLYIHECKSICIQSPNCAAFNYNYTARSCTHFTNPCIQALSDPMMEFGRLMSHLKAQQCYEWRPTAARDWDRAVEDEYPKHFVIRMLKDGTYYVGHWSYTYSICSATIDGTNYNYLPCESLWIMEGCTVYSQPYIMGEPLPKRAVIADTLASGDYVYVASNGPEGTGQRLPGYFIVSNGYARSVYYQTTRFNILVVL